MSRERRLVWMILLFCVIVLIAQVLFEESSRTDFLVGVALMLGLSNTLDRWNK